MKFIGKVSLFFILGTLVFAAGAYANATYVKWFYPNRESGPYFLSDTPQEGAEREIEGDLPAGAPYADVIDSDTVFQIEEYDRDEDTTVEHDEDIPGKYIGMDRESFVDAMASYEVSPPLEEQQRGLISVEVLAFSAERVRVRKSYQLPKEPEAENFYLVAEDHHITVYTEDMQNVYLYTNISMESLPAGLQEEIIERKLIHGEDNLYHFLESYSS